jgi:hypothetical protein
MASSPVKVLAKLAHGGTAAIARCIGRQANNTNSRAPPFARQQSILRIAMEYLPKSAECHFLSFQIHSRQAWERNGSSEQRLGQNEHSVRALPCVSQG